MSIRKVQANPGGLQTAFPFRPGLRLDLSYRDPDEMRRTSNSLGNRAVAAWPGTV